jgi:Kef-type K+ transport system membrane component KefB
MSGAEFGSFSLLLLLLIATAHLFGHLFNRLKQPRVVGEILAGVVLGPSVLGRVAPALSSAWFVAGDGSTDSVRSQAVVGFLYNLGLLMLMFASGAETKGLFRREERRPVAWLGGIGTGLPFVLALAAGPFLPLGVVMGPANHRISLLLVIGIAVAVTSIPVISRIFHDLRILHTRFARLILGVAVVEDLILWGVLAVATALAASVALAPSAIAAHVAAVVSFLALGLTVLPAGVRAVTHASWNVLATTAPIAYVVTVLLAYTAIGSAIGVSSVFAAFLAGHALVTARRMRKATAALNRVSFSVFIPLYFAVVGYQLDLVKTFSFGLVIAVLAGACLVKLLAAGLAARLAGFPWTDSANLAIALNARGGPGIVLATVAYDARIINAEFQTALVVLAVATSQAAGAWLHSVVRARQPLLTDSAVSRRVAAISRRRRPGKRSG